MKRKKHIVNYYRGSNPGSTAKTICGLFLEVENVIPQLYWRRATCKHCLRITKNQINFMIK